MSISTEEIVRVKALGFLHNKDTENFSARVLTENTCLNSEQLKIIAVASDKFADGKVSLTARMSIEILSIPYENIDALLEFVKANGMSIGGTGDKVRPVTSCKGTLCKFGLIDTHKITQEIHEKFYVGYREVKLPHKFKIGVGGCSHNCIKPMLNDIGLVGSLNPIYKPSSCRACKKCGCQNSCPVDVFKTMADGKRRLNRNKCIQCGRCENKCPFGAHGGCDTGIRIFVGGTWGKEIKIGKALKGLYSQEDAFKIIEKTILYFRDNGLPKERLGKLIDRVSFKTFQNEILK